MKTLPPLLSAAVLTLFCLSAAGAGASADVKLTEQKDGKVLVEVGGKPFTVYHFNDNEGRPFVRPYFYPVRAPDGTEVTDDQVLTKGDHPHHRSLWVSHGDVNGADHWSFQQNPPPRQRHIAFRRLEGNTIVEELEWDSKARGTPVLKELRTVRFFTFDDGSRGIDLAVAVTAPPEAKRVVLGDTKEAGMCAVRMKKDISDNPTLTNAAGKTGEDQCWGKPAEWCDISGKIAGKPYGVAVLDHPSNPRHPSTWHVRKYGLLAANIFGLHDFNPKLPRGSGDFAIEPGRTVTFRYRVVVHGGDAKTAMLDQKFKDYAAEIVRADKKGRGCRAGVAQPCFWPAPPRRARMRTWVSR